MKKQLLTGIFLLTLTVTACALEVGDREATDINIAIVANGYTLKVQNWSASGTYPGDTHIARTRQEVLEIVEKYLK